MWMVIDAPRCSSRSQIGNTGLIGKGRGREGAAKIRKAAGTDREPKMLPTAFGMNLNILNMAAKRGATVFFLRDWS